MRRFDYGRLQFGDPKIPPELFLSTYLRVYCRVWIDSKRLGRLVTTITTLSYAYTHTMRTPILCVHLYLPN